MNNQKNSSHIILTVLAACACALAVISFFLPMVSINFFGSWSIDGFELMEECDDQIYMIIIALAGSAMGVVFGLLGLVNRKLLVGNLFCSVIAVATLVVVYIAEDMFEMAGLGFYLFCVAHLASIVLSIVAMAIPDIPKTEPAEKICLQCGRVVAVHQSFCDGCGAALQVNRPVSCEMNCPGCGNAVEVDASFCKFCGMTLKKSMESASQEYGRG